MFVGDQLAAGRKVTASVQLVDQLLVFVHVEKHDGLVGVGQGERGLASDALALGVADEDLLQRVYDLVVVDHLSMFPYLPQLEAVDRVPEHPALVRELVERGRKGGACHQPHQFGLW